jgi:polyhydroxybutyrate depolymerase
MTGKLADCFWLFAVAVCLAGCAAAPAEPAVSISTPAPTAVRSTESEDATAAVKTEPAAPRPLPSGDTIRRLDVNGTERTYLLHVPPGLSSDSPAPLLFVFHGNKMDGEEMRALTGFDDLADANGFFVVYPVGTGLPGALSFNAGTCCGSAEKAVVDDVTFARRMMSDLAGLLPIDPRRVYSTGFSNGGMFSYRLACEMSETFAAIASVAGTVAIGPCRPDHPVSILHIHGMSDTSIPYSGYNSDPDTDQAFLSVEQSIEEWAAIDGCSDSPRPSREGAVTHLLYSACKGGTAVELYALQGLFHQWPPTILFPASRTIWEFFAEHPKSESTG